MNNMQSYIINKTNQQEIAGKNTERIDNVDYKSDQKQIEDENKFCFNKKTSRKRSYIGRTCISKNDWIRFCNRCQYPLNQFFGYFQNKKTRLNYCKICLYNQNLLQYQEITTSNDIKIKGQYFQLDSFCFAQQENQNTVSLLYYYLENQNVKKDHDQFLCLLELLKKISNDYKNIYEFLQLNYKRIKINEQIFFIYTNLKSKNFFKFIYNKIQLFIKERLRINEKDDEVIKFNKRMYNNKIFQVFVINKIQETNYIEQVHLLSQLLSLLSNQMTENPYISQGKQNKIKKFQQLTQRFNEQMNKLLFKLGNQQNIYCYQSNPFKFINQFSWLYYKNFIYF